MARGARRYHRRPGAGRNDLRAVPARTETLSRYGGGMPDPLCNMPSARCMSDADRWAAELAEQRSGAVRLRWFLALFLLLPVALALLAWQV